MRIAYLSQSVLISDSANSVHVTRMAQAMSDLGHVLHLLPYKAGALMPISPRTTECALDLRFIGSMNLLDASAAGSGACVLLCHGCASVICHQSFLVVRLSDASSKVSRRT